MDQKELEQMSQENEIKNDIVIENSQELARNFYEQGGWKPEEIPSHLNGINFNKEVNNKTLEAGTLLASYQNPESIKEGKQGNYYASVEDVNRRELGIENESPHTQNRELQIYRVNQNVQALESTTNSIEDWQGSGEVFTGEGKQLCIPNQDREALTLEFPAHVLYPVPVNHPQNALELEPPQEKAVETSLIPYETEGETSAIPYETSNSEPTQESSSHESESETSGQIY